MFLNLSLNVSSDSVDLSLLGGLLVSGFKKESCLSRYQSYLYRKASPYKPSLHLLSKLRAYEELHKGCGPGTRSYTNAERLLKQKQTGEIESEGCKYVVWMSFSGLGNRIISIASVFLYAMLTDRSCLLKEESSSRIYSANRSSIPLGYYRRISP